MSNKDGLISKALQGWINLTRWRRTRGVKAARYLAGWYTCYWVKSGKSPTKLTEVASHNSRRKLHHNSFRGIVYDWLFNYITNRQQYIEYNTVKSKKGSITCGVPQGSILGPLLFLLYVNDLPHVTNTLDTLIFADDINLFIQGPDITQPQMRLNEEIRTPSDRLKLTNYL